MYNLISRSSVVLLIDPEEMKVRAFKLKQKLNMKQAGLFHSQKNQPKKRSLTVQIKGTVENKAN